MSLERFHSIDSFEALSKSRKRTRQCAQTCANLRKSAGFFEQRGIFSLQKPERSGKMHCYAEE
jgi:hypothetical protein